MEVKEAINKRRAYRSLAPITITEELIKELSLAASLAPSCSNNQPWRFVFVYDKNILNRLFESLTPGNVWAKSSSMMIAIFSKKELDCIVKGKEYYWFDIGLATGFILLRATELNLVAHLIAGFDERIVKEVLNIPDEMTVLTLCTVGKHADTISPILSEKQIENEHKRLPLEKFAYFNIFK
jgi:nitroreductase